MLYEIPYINGYTEFLEYFSREITIDLGASFSEYKYTIELDEPKVLDRTLEYSFPEEVFEGLDVSIKQEGDTRWYVTFSSSTPLIGLKVTISYTYENTDPKNLYSIDYLGGVVHFSEETDKEYEIEYSADNLMTTGKEVRQLSSEEFTVVQDKINIRNNKDNAQSIFLYKNELEEHRNITPVVQDLKINYIIKDDTSL